MICEGCGRVRDRSFIYTIGDVDQYPASGMYENAEDISIRNAQGWIRCTNNPSPSNHDIKLCRDCIHRFGRSLFCDAYIILGDKSWIKKWCEFDNKDMSYACDWCGKIRHARSLMDAGCILNQYKADQKPYLSSVVNPYVRCLSLIDGSERKSIICVDCLYSDKCRIADIIESLCEADDVDLIDNFLGSMVLGGDYA